VSRRPGRRPAR